LVADGAASQAESAGATAGAGGAAGGRRRRCCRVSPEAEASRARQQEALREPGKIVQIVLPTEFENRLNEIAEGLQGPP